VTTLSVNVVTQALPGWAESVSIASTFPPFSHRTAMTLRSLYLIGQSTIYQCEPFRNVSPSKLEKITTSQRKKGFQRIGLSTRNEWSTIASIGQRTSHQEEELQLGLPSIEPYGRAFRVHVTFGPRSISRCLRIFSSVARSAGKPQSEGKKSRPLS
jgi:hypothetical protein